MSWSSITQLKRLLRLHYLTNICLSLSFLFLRCISPFCHFLFNSCQLDYVMKQMINFINECINCMTYSTKQRFCSSLRLWLSSELENKVCLNWLQLDSILINWLVTCCRSGSFDTIYQHCLYVSQNGKCFAVLLFRSSLWSLIYKLLYS